MIELISCSQHFSLRDFVYLVFYHFCLAKMSPKLLFGDENLLAALTYHHHCERNEAQGIQLNLPERSSSQVALTTSLILILLMQGLGWSTK